MLTGKSPSSSCLPAGRIDHWFGRRIEPSAWAPGNTGVRLAGSPAPASTGDRRSRATAIVRGMRGSFAQRRGSEEITEPIIGYSAGREVNEC